MNTRNELRVRKHTEWHAKKRHAPLKYKIVVNSDSKNFFSFGKSRSGNIVEVNLSFSDGEKDYQLTMSENEANRFIQFLTEDKDSKVIMGN